MSERVYDQGIRRVDHVIVWPAGLGVAWRTTVVWRGLEPVSACRICLISERPISARHFPIWIANMSSKEMASSAPTSLKGVISFVPSARVDDSPTLEFKSTFFLSNQNCVCASTPPEL